MSDSIRPASPPASICSAPFLLFFLFYTSFTPMEAGKRNRRIYCIQLSDRVLMDASGDGATGMMSCSPSLIWPEMHELNCRWAV
uniref:Uncharacterized protein n=1 Tax=Oryza nivara TaxID=4536 RepID=A0A0E0HN51_ORYNI